MMKVPVEEGYHFSIFGYKTTHTRSHTQRVPPLLQSKSSGAVIVIIDAANQLDSVATLPARLLILTGSI